MKITNQPIKLERPKPRIYTTEELQKFHDLIQKFYEDYVLETGPERGKTIKILNYEKLSTAYGATDEDGKVILIGFGSETDSKGSTSYWYNKPTRQEQLENILEQYYWWKSGKDWVEQKKLAQLEETARTISEEKTIDHPEEEFNGW